MDASVIGLSKFVEALSVCIKPGGTLVALVKPQFEASRDVVSKGKGVVTGEVDRQAWLVALTDMKATLHNAVVAAGRTALCANVRGRLAPAECGVFPVHSSLPLPKRRRYLHPFRRMLTVLPS